MIKKIIINILIISLLITLLIFKYSDFIRIKGILPDFFLILTVFNGIFNGPIFAMIFGFSSGIAFDLVDKYPIIGFYALIYTIIAYSTSITKIIYIDNALTATISILLFILLKCFLFLSFRFFFLNIEDISHYFKNIFLIQTLYTLIISIPIFLIFKRFSSRPRKYIHDV